MRPLSALINPLPWKCPLATVHPRYVRSCRCCCTAQWNPSTSLSSREGIVQEARPHAGSTTGFPGRFNPGDVNTQKRAQDTARANL